MSRVIDEHRQYLSDAARVSAFASAIAEVVRTSGQLAGLWELASRAWFPAETA